jgi:hypothetical protein
MVPNNIYIAVLRFDFNGLAAWVKSFGRVRVSLFFFLADWATRGRCISLRTSAMTALADSLDAFQDLVFAMPDDGSN